MATTELTAANFETTVSGEGISLSGCRRSQSSFDGMKNRRSMDGVWPGG